jgi:hypothetical protein
LSPVSRVLNLPKRALPIGTLTLSRWHITAIEMTAEGLPLYGGYGSER